MCLTSSFVSTLSCAGFGLRAMRGAVILEKQIVFSGGGPPFGWPLMTTASPERTYKWSVCIYISNNAGNNPLNFLYME